MPYEELLGWAAYFERRPVDWRDDDRTFKLLQVQGVKAKAMEIFPSLKALYAQEVSPVKEDKKVDLANFKKSVLFEKIRTARGGDKINYD